MTRRARVSIAACACAVLLACRPPPRADVVPGERVEEEVGASEPSSVAAPAPVPSDDTRALDPRVVLVTIDGVRWQDVFGGGDPSLAADGELDAFADPLILAPYLNELASMGVAFGADVPGCGVVRAHGTSNVSLPGYFEILTGRSTSCRSNVCPRAETPTVLDDAARAGMTAASIASWDTIDRAASRGDTGVFVAAGARTWPASPATPELSTLFASGRRTRPFPAPARTDYRPDAFTMPIALEYLRTQSARVLHVALGDTDEWAHRGDYVAYLKALHDADDFIGQVVGTLGDQGLLSSTTILVTTDHGRARNFRSHGAAYPESRRAFLFAMGPSIPHRGLRCASRDVELIDVGATMRRLLGLTSDDGPAAGHAIEEIVGGRSD